MRIAGIQGVRRGAHRTVTTTRDERAPRHPDLVKRGWAAPNRPDAVWVADFTYYVELLIMSTSVRSVLVSGVCRANLVGIIPAA
jgi:hypothetical protein